MDAPNGRRFVTPLAALGTLIAVAAPVSAQDSGAEPPPGAGQHHEQPDDPWRPYEPPAHPPFPADQTLLRGFGIVQVNVDEFGNNIPGDAANEPSLAVDPTAPNRIAAGWRQFDTIQSSFRQAGWAWSDDGGRAWTFPGVINPGIFRSDPVLDFDADGNFYYLSLDTQSGFSCDVFVSGDGGKTWDAGAFSFGGDKEWFGIDRTGGVGDGHLYHVWSPFFSCCNDSCCVVPGFFTRSIDGAQTWDDPIDLPVDLFWGTVSVGPGGELYLCGRDSSLNSWVTKSSNAQNPLQLSVFEQTTMVDLGGVMTASPDDGPNPAGLSGQMWVATDHSGGPTHGNIYLLASVDPPGSDPRDVMFARSEDGGATWSAPLRVNDDPVGPPNEQWFGTMSVAPNGRIDVIWNDTRNGGFPNISELFYSFSTDGGVSWSVNQAISPPFNSYLGWPQQNKIGDYYDMISDEVGRHLIWSATFNGEQDVYYSRIGDWDCNGNGIGDSDDLVAGSSQDCNGNDIPDECEIAAGAIDDSDGDGIPDVCEGCPADVNGDGEVDVSDLTAVILAWGACKGCPADINGDGEVDVPDLTTVILAWGPCE